MNTKTKNIVAVLMASIIAMAMFAPMAMGQGTGTGAGAEVGNMPPQICCCCVNPNEFYLDPCPETTTVTICACVCDPNGNADINTVTAVTPKGDIILLPYPGSDSGSNALKAEPSCVCEPALSVDSDSVPCECVAYTGSFKMECCDKAGDYEIKVTVTDKQEASAEGVCGFTVLSMVYLSMDFDNINFGDVEMGVPACVFGDDVMGTSEAPTIHNLGNDPMVITIHATKMRGPGGEIDMELDANVPGTGKCVDGTYLPPCEEICFDHVFDCCVETPIDFSIHVPYGTLPGSYVGKIMITGSHAPCV